MIRPVRTLHPFLMSQRSEPMGQLLLALAYQKHGEPDKARRLCEKARAILEQEPPAQTASLIGAGAAGAWPQLATAAGVQPVVQRRWDWTTELEVRLLRREVEAALAAQPR
jgi:hypothetical protein